MSGEGGGGGVRRFSMGFADTARCAHAHERSWWNSCASVATNWQGDLSNGWCKAPTYFTVNLTVGENTLHLTTRGEGTPMRDPLSMSFFDAQFSRRTSAFQPTAFSLVFLVYHRHDCAHKGVA